MISWLIESDTFENPDILRALTAHAVPYKTCKYQDLMMGRLPTYSDEDLVIFYGSIQSLKWLKQRKPFRFVAFWDNEEFDFLSYAHEFGHHLLNHDFRLTSIGKLKQYPEEIPESGFIRPNRGDKIFSGTRLQHQGAKLPLEIAVYDPPNKTLVVLAPLKEVTREWRLIICNQRVLTLSQYMDYRLVMASDPGIEGRVISYAEGVLGSVGYNPHPVWILDICEFLDPDTDSPELRVLEVGSFTTSGLYECDWMKIIPEVTQVATGEQG